MVIKSRDDLVKGRESLCVCVFIAFYCDSKLLFATPWVRTCIASPFSARQFVFCHANYSIFETYVNFFFLVTTTWRHWTLRNSFINWQMKHSLTNYSRVNFREFSKVLSQTTQNKQIVKFHHKFFDHATLKNWKFSNSQLNKDQQQEYFVGNEQEKLFFLLFKQMIPI